MTDTQNFVSRRACRLRRKAPQAALPPEWPQVRQAILRALAEYPEARAAVAAAIRKFASEDKT